MDARGDLAYGSYACLADFKLAKGPDFEGFFDPSLEDYGRDAFEYFIDKYGATGPNYWFRIM